MRSLRIIWACASVGSSTFLRAFPRARREHGHSRALSKDWSSRALDMGASSARAPLATRSVARARASIGLTIGASARRRREREDEREHCRVTRVEAHERSGAVLFVVSPHARHDEPAGARNTNIDPRRARRHTEMCRRLASARCAARWVRTRRRIDANVRDDLLEHGVNQATRDRQRRAPPHARRRALPQPPHHRGGACQARDAKNSGRRRASSAPAGERGLEPQTGSAHAHGLSLRRLREIVVTPATRRRPSSRACVLRSAT